MMEVPQGFDFSFLNEEEARTILRVLERNEALQRAEKDRISKLQKTKRDIRWLQGVTGEWFEEIQRKKFCNETDVSQMLKPPLTYRLKKEITQNDSMKLQTSRSKNLMNQKPSASSPMSFRSSFASLFSFRKAVKEPSKLQWLRQKGCDSGRGSPVFARGPTDQEKISLSHLKNHPVNSLFVPKPSTMREEGRPPPWGASRLENEFFRVLDDLDSKLAQEQSISSANASYASSTQSGHSYSSRNRPRGITGRPQNHYHETSNMSIYDILRPGTPREGFKTFSPRTKTIYDMYRTKEPRGLEEDGVQKNTFGSTSLCFDSRQRLASPALGHFTARSLHFPTPTENRNRVAPASYQQSPKRTPLSSIIWNRSDFSRDKQRQEEFYRAPSPMEIDPAGQGMDPHCLQNRRHEWFHSQNAYQNTCVNDPLETAMSPDIFENSENMPFYHQDNPFARSFFSNAFRQSREHRFGQSSFWGQQENHYSHWPDFHQDRNPFSSSHRDLEMFPFEANVQGTSVPSQHWRAFSPVYRSQENPHPWQCGFQMPPLENMELSHMNENQQTPYFGTPTVGSLSGLNRPMEPSGLEYQMGSFPEHMQRNEEPYAFGMDQNQAPSFRTSFFQIPDDKRNSQNPNFPNSTVILHNVIPDKPDSLPGRCHSTATGTNSHALDSLPLAETQPRSSVTEMNEKGMNNSLSQHKQLSKSDQTNMTEIPPAISQTAISNPSTDFQNSLSQDSVKNDRSGLNLPSIESSQRSPRIFSRKNASPMCMSEGDTSNELKGNRKVDSAAFLPFLQKSTTPLSFPSPNPSCHKTLAISNEDISSISKNSQQCSEPTDNQNTQASQEPSIVDTEVEQYPTPHSTNCSNRPCDSSALPSGAPPNSSPSNYSFCDTPVSSSTTMVSTRSPSNNGSFLGENEETDTAGTKQNNQSAILSPSETPKSIAGHVPLYEDVVDFVKGRSHSPFRNGKGRGHVRHRISCIEKLSQTARCSVPPSADSSPTEHQNSPKASELNTIYCTLPRKTASFLINSGQPEGKVRATSIRHGPLPFQVKKTGPDSVKRHESNKRDFPQSMRECSQVVSDSIPMASEATERMGKVRPIRSASVRKGPLPFLVGRSMSCPSEKPCAPTASQETNNSPVTDTDASLATSKTRERLFSSLETSSSFRDNSFTQSPHPKELSQESTERNREMAAPGTGEENPLPFCAHTAPKENKNTLHKFKTTSMFSVSGNEDNVKCLEVVSVYYTLPRKASKKFCNLLQQYAQNMNSLTESLQVETEASPSALGEKLKDSTQEQSSSPSLYLKMPLSSTVENVADIKLPDWGPSEPMLEEMAPVSLHKEESKSKEILQGDLAKTPSGDCLQSRKKRGRTLQSEPFCISLIQQEENTTAENPENGQESIQAENGGPFSSLPAHSEDNGESSQTRSSGESEGSGVASARWSPESHPAPAAEDSSSEPHAGELGGDIGTDHPKMTENIPADAESQALALTSASQTLRREETDSGKPDSGKSEPRELPQGNQELHLTEIRKAGGERHKLACQTSLTEGDRANDTNWDVPEGGEDRCIKHRLAAMSKASRKFPSNHFNSKRHVATIFPQSGNESGFGLLSLGRLEGIVPSARPAVKSTESVDENILSDEGMNMEEAESPLQVTSIASRETSSHSCHQKSNDISPRPQHELQNVSESLPKHENSKDVTVAQLLEEESGSTAKFTPTGLREADFSDYQRRLSPPFSLETVQKSLMNLSLATYQQQHRRLVSSEWEPEPHLYRSKSLKSIHVQGDLDTSQPPKVRGRHFSESNSIDNVLSPLTLGNDFANYSGYNRRFKSFSELPSCDENENWALCSNHRAKTGLKSASSISRPIDYGIFGKEQQLAFLENVKRSLTQGRLWKPSFLKNPGFLKDSVCNLSNSSQKETSSSSSPEDGSCPIEPLNIYEEDPVESDWDTDTTTDDEYYLDEKDKESEL